MLLPEGARDAMFAGLDKGKVKSSKASNKIKSSAESSLPSKPSSSEQLALLCRCISELSPSSDLAAFARSIDDMVLAQSQSSSVNSQYWQQLVDQFGPANEDQVDVVLDEKESTVIHFVSLVTLQHLQIVVDVFALMGNLPSQVRLFWPLCCAKLDVTMSPFCSMVVNRYWH